MTECVVQLKEGKTLPDGWRWVKLGEVCEFLDHLRIPVNDVERRLRTVGKQQAELYPYYGANGQVGWIDDYLFDEELVLLAEDGGFFGSFDRPIAYRVSGKCWVNNHAHVLRARKDLADVDWLYLALAIRPDIIQFVSGTTRMKLNQDQASLIPVALPPLPEQKRIAARIQELMQDVERARTACEAQLEAAKALPRAYLRQVFESEEAKKWERRRLGEVCEFSQYGLTAAATSNSNGFPYLRITDIDESGNLKIDGIKYVGCDEATYKNYALQEGDILFARSGSIGRTFLYSGIPPNAVFASYLIRFRLKREMIEPSYLFYYTRSAAYYSFIEEKKHTVSQPNINAREYSQLSIPTPSLPEQKRIANELRAKMEEAEKLKASIEKQLEAIRALPQAILRKAFSGEL